MKTKNNNNNNTGNLGKLGPEWDDWVSARPSSVQKLCRKFPPNQLYQLKSTGQRVVVYSYNEAGTLTVDVTAQFNLLSFERRVFGVTPDDLEPCDLLPDDEPTGAWLDGEDEVDEWISLVKGINYGKRD